MTVQSERGVFADHARLIRSTFLYRVIDLERPITTRLVYTGWWFRQKIELDGIPVWFRISWLSIRPRAEFRVPSEVDPSQPTGKIEINFGTGLSIRRFRVWINDQIAYDEIR